MWSTAAVQQTGFFHCTIDCSSADFNSSLRQSYLNSIHSVITVVRMFIEDVLDYSRKKLPPGCFVSVFQPSVITGFADIQNLAHAFNGMLSFSCKDILISSGGFYLFRSFAKKPSASFSMSFAFRNSAFSRSSSLIRASCAAGSTAFTGAVASFDILFLFRFLQSASV